MLYRSIGNIFSLIKKQTSILKNIFSVQNQGMHKVFTVLGFKIKLKSHKLQTKLIYDNILDCCFRFEELKTCLIASKLHSYLEKYKGCYREKDIVIVGCGPTLEYFEPIKDAIYIGINRAFKCEKVKFDYLFASDNFPEGMEEFFKYRQNECNKFIRYWSSNLSHRLKTTDYIENKFQKVLWGPNERMPMDISIEPFGSYNWFSTSSVAMQFSLYTLPRRIYLVGMDCTINNIYRNSPTAFFDGTYHNNVDGWKMMKEDIENFYPGIEIISVNPIGLKGVFSDIYTQSFIAEHSDLLNENIEILR